MKSPVHLFSTCVQTGHFYVTDGLSMIQASAILLLSTTRADTISYRILPYILMTLNHVQNVHLVFVYLYACK